MKVLLIACNNVRQGLEPPLPLGLACVAASTEKARHEVLLVQLTSDSGAEGEIEKLIEEHRPDVIGISVRNIDNQNMQNPRFLLPACAELVKSCRRVSRACIAVGGAGYSIFPQSALAFLQADLGIEGEGELVFPVFLSSMQAGTAFTEIPGVHVPGQPSTPKCYVEDLDALPLPAPHIWLNTIDWDTRIPVQSRRGCPLDCVYCSTAAIEGKAIRTRSPERLVSWMSAAAERGFHKFYFVDSTFNLPPSYAKELCCTLIEYGLSLDWWAMVYPKWIDLELVRLMARAGCTQVSLGFESGAGPVLRNLNKRYCPLDIQIISEMFADAGVKRAGFLLLGGPGETRDTVEASLAFADSLSLDSLKITAGIRIYPNTTLARAATSEGVIDRDDDLLFPRFYTSPTVREWLPDRIAQIATA